MTDMDALSWNLLFAAVAIAVVHTALGPDHYLPFVMLGRARRWSLARTLSVTALCGLGHVGSSLLLGGLGVALGAALSSVEGVERARSGVAGWALVTVGVAYALWGLRHAWRERRGLALHAHGGHVHLHAHGGHIHLHHAGERAAVRAREGGEAQGDGARVTFWALFVVFVLGPCEPLLPLFVVPASAGRWTTAIVVGAAFAVATLATMLAITGALALGVSRVPLRALERWSHALAGAVVAGSGLGMVWLGW